MKDNCKISTPEYIVEKMLDIAGYTYDLDGKRVLENSCGDGNILSVIVKRYICDGISRGLSLEKIHIGLQNDIWATEVDPLRALQCKNKLDDIARRHGLYNINWNIETNDSLTKAYDFKFRFVIGNPPYISYWKLKESVRSYVKNTFSVCKQGSFDYCYAFIESGIKHLEEQGKMVYLIPNSIFKVKFGRTLRELLLKDLSHIIDYTTKKIFDEALTSSAIIKIDKGNNRNTIKYHDVVSNKVLIINKKSLDNNKWTFESISKAEKVFGDYFHVATSIATQKNDVFVLSEFDDCEEYIESDHYKIEKKILRKAYSPRNRHINKTEYIIFPYYFLQGQLMRYSEDELEKLFPYCYIYLKNKKDVLLKRDSDKNAAWYEFGRSQALAHLNQEKLMLSTVITKSVKVYQLAQDEIPYSGIYITAKSNMDLTEAHTILESHDFFSYIKKVGINASGDSIRISCRDVSDYTFV